jgi:hypothetical protein
MTDVQWGSQVVNEGFQSLQSWIAVIGRHSVPVGNGTYFVSHAPIPASASAVPIIAPRRAS